MPTESPAAKKPKTDDAINGVFSKHSVCLVLDYGSQYTQLIARRVRENGVLSMLLPGDVTLVSCNPCLSSNSIKAYVDLLMHSNFCTTDI